jgi:hypothetical protein
LALLCGCALLVPPAEGSQSLEARRRPYVAVSKRTIYYAEPSAKAGLVKEVIRRTEARDSQGRRYSSAGSNLPAEHRYDWIRDVVAGKSYLVNRHQRVAYFRNLEPAEAGPHPADSGMQAVEVNGVPCIKGPSRMAGPGAAGEVIGTTCVSAELGNLLVYDDITVNLGGEKLRLVTELEQFQLDVEPPREWFEIPPDFRLLAGEPGRAVPQP